MFSTISVFPISYAILSADGRLYFFQSHSFSTTSCNATNRTKGVWAYVDRGNVYLSFLRRESIIYFILIPAQNWLLADSYCSDKTEWVDGHSSQVGLLALNELMLWWAIVTVYQYHLHQPASSSSSDLLDGGIASMWRSDVSALFAGVGKGYTTLPNQWIRLYEGLNSSTM